MKKAIQFDNVPSPIQETLEWLLLIEDFSTARSLAKTVFRNLPTEDPKTSDFLAYVLYKSKFYREAAEASLNTLKLLPNSPGALFNAARSLNFSGDPAAAEKLIRRALELDPKWLDAKIELAVFVSMQGRFDEGMKILLDLLSQYPEGDPNLDIINFNLGWHYMRLGNFKKGMSNLGVGRRLNIWGKSNHGFRKPVLMPGISLEGKTVLISGEGGAGDEMIAARFGKIISERGGKAVFVSTQPLLSLFSRIRHLDRVVTRQQTDGLAYDYWAPGMDLPRILDLEQDEIPREPYILPDEKYVRKWAGIIARNDKLKVGLRWQGNPLYEQDLRRSVPFSLLEKLTEIPGIDFYSLQRDQGAEERPANSPVTDLGPMLSTWEDTAGAIQNLDLIISSCTSVPHLAGAIGKTTWLLCPMNCYYLWTAPQDNSPWYSSVHLYRQAKFDSWAAPIQKIARDLAALSNVRHNPRSL